MIATETQWLIGSGLAVWIFTAGGLLTWARMSIAQLKAEIGKVRGELYKDVNGIGGAVRRNEDAAARRHHNVSLAIILIAPVAREKEVCEFLREG